MLSKMRFCWLPSAIVLLGLAGCAGFDQKNGLNPVIDGVAVQNASTNKALLLNALATDAGYRPDEPVDYYTVASRV